MAQIRSQHSQLELIQFHLVNLEEIYMAHYAFINTDNIVVEVITGKDETDTETLPEGFDSWEQYYETKRDGLICKRTSYNTQNGEHLLDGTPFRANYAGIGYTYEEEDDIFLPPKPYPSWQLYADNPYVWAAPLPYPNDFTDPDDISIYGWDEEAYQADNTTGWVLVEVEGE